MTAIALFVVVLAPPAASALPRVKGDEKSVRLNALFVRSGSGGAPSTGGTNVFTVRMKNSDTKEFRVGFTENEVAGTGDQWRAAGWNAATVATLVTGSPLGGSEVTFDVNGQIDGPSAGALSTIGVLSLLRGDKLKSDITMTGTINPDGTVGPVGGIPYKVDGVVQAKKKRMLIPAGQRNSEDDSGNLVDVARIGEDKGVNVEEVADIYDAYKQFTGKVLPRPPENRKVELSRSTYDRMRALTEGWLAEHASQVGQFGALDPLVQSAFSSVLGQANDFATRAQDLSKQGLQAGAYQQAFTAAAFSRAAVSTARAEQAYLSNSDLQAFVNQINSSAALEGKVDALLGKLRAETPKTVTEAGGLISAYSLAFEALSLARYAGDVYQQAQQSGDIGTAAEGAVYSIFAAVDAEVGDQLLGVARGGPKLSSSITPARAGDFFRKAAEANFNAFDKVVVEEMATKLGLSTDRTRAGLAKVDFNYALALSGRKLVDEASGLKNALKGGKNIAYGELGGSVGLYVASTDLLNQYYSLGALVDNDFNVVGVARERSMTSALDFAQDQAGRSIGVLVDRKIDPSIQTANYEVGRIDRDGSVADKFHALNDYLAAYVESRLLTYLGGFSSASLKK